MTQAERRAREALDIANAYGSIDGDHHKTWVIDQMVRALTGCAFRGRDSNRRCVATSRAYRAFVVAHCNGDDGPCTYDWSAGVAP